METEFEFTAFGCSVSVLLDSEHEDLLARARPMWRRCDGEATNTVSLTPDPSLLDGDPERFLTSLVSNATLAAIEAAESRWLLVHAATVANPETGECIAFVGPSGAGKTTLSNTLGKHFGYVSDETLGVNLETLEVSAYPKPLLFKRDGRDFKIAVGPDELGLLEAPKSLSLRAVFLLNRIDGVEAAEVSRIPALSVLERLVPQVSYLARRQNPVQDLVELISVGSGLRVVSYSESEQLVALVRDEFDAPVTAVLPVIESAVPAELNPDEAIIPLGCVAALNPQSCLIIDNQLVFFNEGKVQALSELATIVWEAAGEVQTLEQLRSSLLADFEGDQPETDALWDSIEQTIQALEDLNLIQLGEIAP